MSDAPTTTQVPERVTGEEYYDGDRPLGEILSDLGNDLGELLQAQVALAKTELKEEAQQLGQAGALGGAASLVATAALVLLGAAGAWAIAEAWPTWSGFLIMTIAYLAIAVALALGARQRLSQATEGPVETLETLKEDAEWLRQHRS